MTLIWVWVAKLLFWHLVSILFPPLFFFPLKGIDSDPMLGGMVICYL